MMTDDEYLEKIKALEAELQKAREFKKRLHIYNDFTFEDITEEQLLRTHLPKLLYNELFMFQGRFLDLIHKIEKLEKNTENKILMIYKLLDDHDITLDALKKLIWSHLEENNND